MLSQKQRINLSNRFGIEIDEEVAEHSLFKDLNTLIEAMPSAINQALIN